MSSIIPPSRPVLLILPLGKVHHDSFLHNWSDDFLECQVRWVVLNVVVPVLGVCKPDDEGVGSAILRLHVSTKGPPCHFQEGDSPAGLPSSCPCRP
jgi:hypothetical protein